MKTCSNCSASKPVEDFYKNQRWCKECSKERNRQWKKENPDKVKKYSRNGHLFNKYRIKQVDFERMLDHQGGGCKVCGSTHRLVVDHDHATGAVRGILCDSCNVSLGKLEDDAARIRALADYVEDTYGP